MISKTQKLEILEKIYLEKQEQIARCDIDLAYYRPRSIIVKDAKSSQFIQNKITTLKAIKQMAKDVSEIITKKILELKIGKGKEAVN